MRYDLTKRATKKRLIEFSEELKEISDKVWFKLSSRGWAYQLEVDGLINKDEFDKVENLINNCRRKGRCIESVKIRYQERYRSGWN